MVSAGNGRIAKSGAHALQRFEERHRRQAANLREEGVGIPGDQPARRKHGDGKVPEVRGEDDVRLSANRGSHHLPVVGIGQFDGV